MLQQKSKSPTIFCKLFSHGTPNMGDKTLGIRLGTVLELVKRDNETPRQTKQSLLWTAAGMCTQLVETYIDYLV